MLSPAAFLAAATFLSSGPLYIGTDKNLKVTVPRIEAAIEVDGVLSEGPWEQAARLAGFSQYAPDDGRAARNATEVLVWYSPTAMHFGIRAQAPAGTVRATLADRDRIDGDDSVLIYLATFNDGRQATVIGVNALGVQMDGAMIETTTSGGRAFGGLSSGRATPDLSPDFVFQSKGRLTDAGYEVEVRVPFKSLRFQSSATQDWGIHIVRRVPSSGHEDSWSPALRSAASFMAQAGTLAGLSDMQRGLVMDLNPAVVARTDGARTQGGWSYDTGRPDVGGNVRWGVTSNLTMNGTVNPDFSQIEADATQFQIDPRQALFFPEKRPFFLDGIEFFSAPSNLVYSRRIVEPIAAVKLTGKAAGTSIAAMSAVDDEDQSMDGRSNPVFTIVRTQRDFGRASRAGMLYTARVNDLSTNHVAGADARLVFRKVYSVDLQGAMSVTSQLADTTGSLFQASLRRTGRRFSLSYAMSGNDANFRTAAGFIGRQNIVSANVTHQLALYGKQGALVERWTGDVQLFGTWDHRGFFAGEQALERKIHFNSNFQLRGGWFAGHSVLVEKYRFDPSAYTNYALLDGDQLLPFHGQTLPNLDYVVSLTTPRIYGLSANGFYLWGRDENFYEWASANIVYATFGVQWRPSERLRVDGTYNLQSFERRTDHSMVGTRRIPRVKVEYQATRAMFVRYVGEYAMNDQDTLRDDSRTNLPIVYVRPDGSYDPAIGFRQRQFRSDWLFSYQPTPGTVLFAGYGNSLLNVDPFDDRRLVRTRDGFFAKVSYLFRL